MTDEAEPVCASCGAPWREGAKFCRACGAREGVVRRERDAELGAVTALVLCFVGVLVVLLASAAIESRNTTSAVVYTGFVVLGLASCASVGRGAVQESLGGAATLKWVGVGFAGGLVAISVNWAYVAGLGALIEPEGFVLPEERPLWLELLDTALVTALLEEWLCRGVLFVACQRLMGQRSTLLVTSILFALLHGLQGYLLAVPHRFATGMILGWLRQRSGSLVPGVIAHAVNNAIAVLLSR